MTKSTRVANFVLCSRPCRSDVGSLSTTSIRTLHQRTLSSPLHQYSMSIPSDSQSPNATTAQFCHCLVTWPMSARPQDHHQERPPNRLTLFNDDTRLDHSSSPDRSHQPGLGILGLCVDVSVYATKKKQKKKKRQGQVIIQGQAVSGVLASTPTSQSHPLSWLKAVDLPMIVQGKSAGRCQNSIHGTG